MKTYIVLKDPVLTDPSDEKTKVRILESSQAGNDVIKLINKGYLFVPLTIGKIAGLNSNNILAIYSIEESDENIVSLKAT